jgi:hypothetical protein
MFLQISLRLKVGIRVQRNMETRMRFKDVKDFPANKPYRGKTTKISPTTSVRTGSRKVKRRLQSQLCQTNILPNQPIRTATVSPLPLNNLLNSVSPVLIPLNNPNSRTNESIPSAVNNLKSTPTVVTLHIRRTTLLNLPVNKTSAILRTDRTTLPNTLKTIESRRTDQSGKVKVNLLLPN